MLERAVYCHAVMCLGRAWKSQAGASLVYLTKLRCTPKPRCLPLHSRHMNIPYDTEAHCGFLVLQSTQVCTCQRVLDLHPKGYDEV